MFVTPPEINATQTFGRKVVFVLDKSGSMAGEPIDAARQALCVGIQSLNDNDFFTIIAFSERQYYFSQVLVRVRPTLFFIIFYFNKKTLNAQATDQSRGQAMLWVQSINAGGLTDILTPLRAAINIMSLPAAELIPVSSVPFIFLVTDGAVENEQVRKNHTGAPCD